MGLKTRQVVFTFDEDSIRTLEEMTEEGQYSCMAECVKESLQITQLFSGLARKGFTQVVMRRPGSDTERVLVVPRLEMLKRASR